MFNEKNLSTVTNEFQTNLENYNSQKICLLQSTRVHICQAKLLVRRARAESMGRDDSACMNRILEGLEHLSRSLGWLATNDSTKIGPSEFTARHVKEVVPEVLRELEAQRSRTAEIDLQCAGGAQ